MKDKTFNGHRYYGETMNIPVWDIFPPAGYSFSVHAYNKKEAREQARFYLGIGKLPKGTEVYRVYR